MNTLFRKLVAICCGLLLAVATSQAQSYQPRPSGGSTTTLSTGTTAGNTATVRGYNTGNSTYQTFVTVTANGTPTYDMSAAVTWDGETKAQVLDAAVAAAEAALLPVNLASEVTGTLPVANGGTGVTSLSSGSAASTLVLRDANANINSNNVNNGYTTTATAAGTTTLTVASTLLQYFTGSTTQTVVLPVTSTLALGQRFVITNASTGAVTVQSSGANTIATVVSGITMTFTCVLTSGTTAASWTSTFSLNGSQNFYIVPNSGGISFYSAGNERVLWNGASYFQSGASGGITAGNGAPSAVNPDVGFIRAVSGVWSFTDGNTTTIGSTWRAIPKTPAQIAADQNNYNPGGTSYYQRWSTDASRNITGITFTAAQVDGQTHVITNIGSQNIVIVNESASSTAANRFHNSTGADITLAADQEVNCWYDATTARWRVTKRGF